MLGHGVPALSWHLRSSLSERQETPEIRLIRRLPAPATFVLSAVNVAQVINASSPPCSMISRNEEGMLCRLGNLWQRPWLFPIHRQMARSGHGVHQASWLLNHSSQTQVDLPDNAWPTTWGPTASKKCAVALAVYVRQDRGGKPRTSLCLSPSHRRSRSSWTFRSERSSLVCNAV